MSEDPSKKLKDLLSKITDEKSALPYYLNILVKSGKKVLDYRIKKLPSKILKLTGHSDGGGWFVRSYHIPIDNINVTLDAKKKEVQEILNNPKRVSDKDTREILDEILRKYEDIQPGSGTGKFNFKTSRFKKRKDYKMGAQKKGF